MFLLRICLLWGLVSIHVIGGAVLFRRLFPRESPWFGFIVPGLALVVALNFIEHGVGLPTLRWMLPFTFLGSLWLIVSPKTRWRFLRLPTIVFLASFAFTLFLKSLRPDIAPVRDGILDLSLIGDFCMGQSLPPVSTWLPPFRLLYYYDFQHYAASVLIRLFGLDMGTGFNLASALLSALIYFLMGAIAWRLGRHRLWIVAAALFLTAAAMDGSTPYLWLTQTECKSPDDATNLLNRADFTTPHFPFDTHLTRMADYWKSHELIPPGYWSWIGAYHSVMAGQVLTLFAVYCLVEMVRRRRTNWPWIGSLGVGLVMLVSSTWGVPLVGAFCVGGVGWCVYRKLTPANGRVVFVGLGVIAIGLTPMLLYFLQTPALPLVSTLPEEKTQPFEFIVQWWPIYVPWLALLFYWRRLNPAVRIVHAVVPVAFLAVEFYTVGARLDMTGKLWGYIYGAAWAVFIPTLAAARSYFLRGILAVLMVTGALSLGFWIDYVHRTIAPENIGRLEGLGDLRSDPVKGRIFNIVSTMNHQLILTGKSVWDYNESSLLASLTHNNDYVAWGFHYDRTFHPTSFGEAAKREREVNALYDRADDQSLAYLRDRNICALVVWPDDRVPGEALSRLEAELSADYWYQDCRDPDAAADAPNAGIFLRRATGGATFPPPLRR
jgi:hypothetical protein